ncbi:MAG: hypothetical protein FWD74_01295 [Actinomycetia bacterium]|nr:hypothetical protein [Actinomycetes bacterium]
MSPDENKSPVAAGVWLTFAVLIIIVEFMAVKLGSQASDGGGSEITGATLLALAFWPFILSFISLILVTHNSRKVMRNSF